MTLQTPRPKCTDVKDPTVAGRLRLRLKNDGEWWKLFDDGSTRDEVANSLTECGIFHNPLTHGKFIENNTVEKIVRDLWFKNVYQEPTIPLNIATGFKRLENVVLENDPNRRDLTLMLALTPLCSTSPVNLETSLNEAVDMNVLCGHDQETRLAWLWFKSLLSTQLAFFWHGMGPPLPVPFEADRDSIEVNDMLRRVSCRTSGTKWMTVEEQEGSQDEDWLKKSFRGFYRHNRTRCRWKTADDFSNRETSLDELIASRITGVCSETGLLNLWLEGNPDLTLTCDELGSLVISTDPWERIDKQSIPLTETNSEASTEISNTFDPALLSPAKKHRYTGIPFELLRGYPCVSKQRHLIC